jgi:hypothetical protein
MSNLETLWEPGDFPTERSRILVRRAWHKRVGSFLFHLQECPLDLGDHRFVLLSVESEENKQAMMDRRRLLALLAACASVCGKWPAA